MTYTCTITNPRRVYKGAGQGASATVQVKEVRISAQLSGEISQCELTVDIADTLAVYDVETNPLNPVHLNSTVILERDGQKWFRGVIKEKPLLRDDGASLILFVRGHEEGLRTSLVPDSSGSYTWSKTTSAVSVTERPILPTTAASDRVERDWWWPAPSQTDMWYEPTGVADAVPTGGINDSQTSIGLASGTWKGFGINGFVKCETEWIWYDGLHYDATSGQWVLLNCIRGALGTTAAAHAQGETITQKVAKEIAPDSPIFLEVDPPGAPDWEDLSLTQEFDFNPFEGKFIFPYSTADHRGTYSVYDVDGSLGGASVLDLSDLVIDILEAPRQFGGAGLTSADYDIPPLGIYITRIDYSPRSMSPYAWELIHEIIERLGLTEEIVFYYDHTAGVFRLRNLAQTAAQLFANARLSIVKERDLEDVRTGILVSYTSEQPRLATKQSDAWRPSSGESQGPTHWVVVQQNSAGDTFHQEVDNNAVPYAFFTGLESYAGPMWESGTPGSAFAMAYFWFGAGAPSFQPDKLEMTIATWGKGEYNFTVQACNDYDPSSSFTNGTWAPLSSQLTGLKGKAAGSVTSGAKQSFTADQFLQKSINAIRIILNFPQHTQTTRDGVPMFLVHIFKFFGGTEGYSFVQLTDGAPAVNQLQAENSFIKLRGGTGATSGTAGVQLTEFWDIGASTAGAAVSAGMLKLRDSLRFYESRSYETDEAPLDASGSILKPELGMTAAIQETALSAYTGIIRGYEIEMNAAGTRYRFDVLDYAAAVIV